MILIPSLALTSPLFSSLLFPSLSSKELAEEEYWVQLAAEAEWAAAAEV